MYLGQLAKIRDALGNSKIRVVLDSRDEEELRNRETDVDAGDLKVPGEIAEVNVTNQVLFLHLNGFVICG
jgi:hypothetical protein